MDFHNIRKDNTKYL